MRWLAPRKDGRRSGGVRRGGSADVASRTDIVALPLTRATVGTK